LAVIDLLLGFDQRHSSVDSLPDGVLTTLDYSGVE